LVSTLPTVEDVQVLEARGPWNSKSGGELSVLFSIPFPELQDRYFKYDDEELAKIPADIRGLRSYTVRGIPAGTVGANEWHRVRQELAFAVKGSAKWTCEDVFGNKKEFMVDEGNAVWTPPFILHTYEAQTDATQLLVIANTLFIPEDPTTHDSYSAESYREFQALHQHM
jgi:hypothetical protein